MEQLRKQFYRHADYISCRLLPETLLVSLNLQPGQVESLGSRGESLTFLACGKEAEAWTGSFLRWNMAVSSTSTTASALRSLLSRESVEVCRGRLGAPSCS